MSVTIGTKLGRYEIRSQIGAGGMGEVYLAQDTELDRPVALKFLTAEVAADQQRMNRFFQEAKAASALNHPNILTVYEIGTSEDKHFLATEFVDGVTLRQRMKTTQLKLGEVLDVAVQVAGALAAAHAAGIVHRDVKPENVMLRPDGLVKVLDFGLAKLLDRQTATGDPEAPTRALVNTDPGLVMGTASYMSPEQASGRNVDARTDIWSFGAMLYEMIAGRVPFEGETPTEVIARVLERDPAPLLRYAPDVPSELQRIVMKALAKDREERYQVSKDMLLDLRALKQDLDVEAKLERSIGPERSGGASRLSARSDELRVPPLGGQSSGAKSSPPEGGTLSLTQPKSSAEYIVTGIKQHKLATLFALAALVLSIIGFSAFWHARSTEVAIESIAVLPFANQNRDPESEYLSDGLTESIINDLTQLANLRVIARSSVFRYKGKETDPMAVGKELGVRAVLTGRLLQRGENLTVGAELLDVRDNKQLWGERYDRKVSDLLSVHREIAKEITGNLRLELTGTEQRRVTKHYTESNEAFQLYLKGRYYWNKRTPEAVKKSIQYFEQAIEKDPTYALVYTGLADSYIVAPDYGILPPKESYPKAKVAATKALEIDETLAEAYASLGMVRAQYDWDWVDAEKEFRRAIELNPNYATAHYFYALAYLSQMGRHREAIAEMKRAQELDTVSLIINANLGWVYYFARQYDQAIEQCQITLDMDPGFVPTHARLGLAYVQKGMYEEAIAELQKAVTLSGGVPYAVADLGHAYAVSGKRAEAQAVIEKLVGLSKQKYVPPCFIAIIYAGLGEENRAFEWLHKAYEERDRWLGLMKVSPQWDTLRSGPRYAGLLRSMDLKP